MRNSLVLAACDQIEKVLLQIRPGACDGMGFVLANHFREGNAQFSSAHRAGKRDHHFSAAIEVRDVGVGSVFQGRSVEMPEMAINELADAAHFHFPIFCNECYWTLMQKLCRGSQALIAFFCRKFSTVQRQESVPRVYLALRRAKQPPRPAERFRF